MRPMLATPGDLPEPDTSPSTWAYEVKWDGMRALVGVTPDACRLTSRTGNDVSASFPEVAGARWPVPAGSLLDGELVAFDEAGRPSFSVLAPRIHRRSSAGAPVTLLLFDVLRLGEDDLTGRPYDERRALLTGLGLDGPSVQVPPSFDDGAALLASTAEQGLEGVVAKRRASPYRPGVRSPDWVKVPHRRTRSYVVGGWKQSTASAGRLGSVLVGTPTGDGTLTYDGAVGSGISGATAKALLTVLQETATPEAPFDAEPGLLPDPKRDGVHWVEPLLVVDVAHLGRGGQGLLRQPSLVRLRPDLVAADVTGEQT